LRQRAQPVTEFDASLRQLVDDMLETLRATQAIGLAATQVDVHRQVVVIDVSDSRAEPQVFVNPEILSRGSTQAMVEEGCLSVPGVNGSVKRSLEVRARWLDADGVTVERELEGILAVCLQHEMDHLAGMLFTDRLSLFRRMRLRLRRRNPKPRSLQ
jgi:peptide deformylase